MNGATSVDRDVRGLKISRVKLRSQVRLVRDVATALDRDIPRHDAGGAGTAAEGAAAADRQVVETGREVAVIVIKRSSRVCEVLHHTELACTRDTHAADRGRDRRGVQNAGGTYEIDPGAAITADRASRIDRQRIPGRNVEQGVILYREVIVRLAQRCDEQRLGPGFAQRVVIDRETAERRARALQVNCTSATGLSAERPGTAMSIEHREACACHAPFDRDAPAAPAAHNATAARVARTAVRIEDAGPLDRGGDDPDRAAGTAIM